MPFTPGSFASGRDDALGAPLLTPGSGEDEPAPPPRQSRYTRGCVRIIEEAKQFDLIGDSSSEDEEAAPHARKWGRYASLVDTRRSRRSVRKSRAASSVRSRQHVEIYAKTREWGGMGSSSSDAEMPGQDRHERYARFQEEIEAEKSAKEEGAEDKGEKGEQGPQGGRLLSLTCCMWCCLQNAVNARLLVLLLQARSLALVCCLAPSAAFLVFLEVCLASTDRNLVHARYRLQRQASSAVKRAALELFIFLVLGCLHGYQLLQAYRHWVGVDPQTNFLTELENLDPSKKLVARRWNSHYLLWSVPTLAALTCYLALGSPGTLDALFWGIVLAAAVVSAAASVESFDSATSHGVRAWYGTVLDRSRCVSGGSQAQRKQRLHQAVRFTEVLGRVLVLAAVFMLFVSYPGCAVAGIAGDYLICLLVLGANSGFTLEVPLVSVVLFLANLARYIDEPGFALPASRVSRVLDVMRGLEAADALFICLAAMVGRIRPPGGALSGEVLLALMLVVHGTNLLLRVTLKGTGGRGDLFTAAAKGDVAAMEQSLSYEGGSTVDMVVCDGSRRTALHLAVAAGSLEGVKLLLSQGAKRNVTDARLQTPLHLAVKGLQVEISKVLLEEEGNSDEEAPSSPKQISQMMRQMNVDGETPRDLLRKGSSPELERILESSASDALQRELESRSRSGGRVGSSDSSRPRSVISSSLLHNVFGSIVGGEHFSVTSTGPREQAQRAELAAFMFFRGMGEQLQRLHLYFRHFRKRLRTTVSHRVHISNLLTVATLGAGGFGKVLKVEDVRSGNFYALKLQCRNKTTKQAVREAQALSTSGQHPYIVELVQIFRTTAFYGILMEFCDKDLNRRILEEETAFGNVEGLARPIAARYTACVMFALEYLHGQSIVFRDLKPENVLIVVAADLAKLTDFGLARRVVGQMNEDGSHAQSTVSVSAGTLGFMSLEAFHGADDDEVHSPSWFNARDWYSLGCCLLLMLLGEGGGRRVYAAKRHVLLPANRDKVAGLLEGAVEAGKLAQDAADLVQSLTEEEVTARGDARTCRRSPFLQDAVAELEPPGWQPVDEGPGDDSSLEDKLGTRLDPDGDW